MIFFIISIFLVYLLTNYYIGQNIIIWLQYAFPTIDTNWFWMIYSLLALTTVFTFVSSFLSIKKDTKAMAFIGCIGEFWMGVYFYSLFFWTIHTCLMTIVNLSMITPTSIISFSIRSMVIIVTTLVIGYGYLQARNLKIKSYSITIDKPTTLDNVSVVLISDLHLGYTNNTNYLRKLVTKINHLHPDIVLIPGDIINGDYYAINNPEENIELFKSISSTYGIYACLGNHDAGSSFDEMASFLEQSQISLLHDDYVVIDDKLIVVGRVDSTPISKQVPSRNKEGMDVHSINTEALPIIVMDHQPSNIKEYDSHTDLIVCGHTHKGQIFPFGKVTHSLFTVDYGYYRKDENSPQVIVTSGAATWGPPLRVGSDSEIVNIKISFNKK